MTLGGLKGGPCGGGCDAPAWLRQLDHTADVGLEIVADELKTLFARSAWGMFWILCDPAAVRPIERARMSVDASDTPALMVRWLSELNYRHLTEHRLFSRFEILELLPTRLIGEAHGEPFDPDRHTLHTEIKAVTYHGLSLEEHPGGWIARIIFDL